MMEQPTSLLVLNNSSFHLWKCRGVITTEIKHLKKAMHFYNVTSLYIYIYIYMYVCMYKTIR